MTTDAGPPLDDLEARAAWHLELEQRAAWLAGADLDDEVEPDDVEGEYLGSFACLACGGTGVDVVCVDDLCNGAGYCIHGDGDEPCSRCHGEGFT
jgi:hypothetical protein